MRRRCRLSDLARARGIDRRNQPRLGHVLPGRPGHPNCQVIWDGLRTPQSYHKSFIDVIDDGPPEPGLAHDGETWVHKQEDG